MGNPVALIRFTRGHHWFVSSSTMVVMEQLSVVLSDGKSLVRFLSNSNDLGIDRVHYIRSVSWAETYREFMQYVLAQAPAQDVTQMLRRREATRRISKALTAWALARQRERAARTIQRSMRRWLFEPVTRDGKLGIHPRLMLRDACAMGMLVVADLVYIDAAHEEEAVLSGTACPCQNETPPVSIE